jgi:hypothetical protein
LVEIVDFEVGKGGHGGGSLEADFIDVEKPSVFAARVEIGAVSALRVVQTSHAFNGLVFGAEENAILIGEVVSVLSVVVASNDPSDFRLA